MRKWIFILGLLGLLGAVSGRRYTKKDFHRLEILVGKWKMKKGNGNIYETWHKRNETFLSGLSYKIVGTDTTYLESVRLFYNKGNITYGPVAYGQNKNEEVPFLLIEIKDDQFVFENPKHDFPQRIVYQSIGQDSVHAYIEGTINGSPLRSDYYFSRIK